ncbi:hypothetical protein HCN83_13815 [Bacillus luteus]|uniref:DUF6431 domain-containing protein n=1 Tax=Alkalicoccus luteus TaxID=1237094 RepID=A0A969PQN8_9BACI|nr:hypothetical protein [Alkalicoccus luteus]
MKDEHGESRTFVIRRLRCDQCQTIHHELPALIIPYKRYAAAVIETAVLPASHLAVAVDESTLVRWRKWFLDLVQYWLFILQSLRIQLEWHETSTVDLSSQRLPVHQRVGQWVGKTRGWLGSLVHPVANHHFWIHTRSAFLTRSSFDTLAVSPKGSE